MSEPNKRYSELIFDRRNLVAWLILAAGLAITLVAGHLTQRSLEQRSLRNFNSQVDNVINLIQNRLRENEQILLGAVGFLNASANTNTSGNANVTREAWRRYITALNLEKNYPGIQGVGYSVLIAPEKLQAHQSAIRQSGFPAYQVHPVGTRAQYSSIIYLEPFTQRNQAAFGYDMLSEAARAEAMTHARDAGQTTITGKVTLVQEIVGMTQAGFLMYVPVYASDTAPETEVQRRAAIRSFVFSPFRADDLMEGTINQKINPVDFTIYDNNKVDDNARLYRSRPSSASDLKKSVALRHAERHLTLFEHTWTITFDSLGNAEINSQNGFVALINIMGTLLSVALFLIVSLQIFRRDRAEQLVPVMYADLLRKQKELEESEERFRAIIQTSPTASRIARIADNHVLFCNLRYLALTETEADDMQHLNPSSYYADPTVYLDIRQRLQRGEPIVDQLVELINPSAETLSSKWVLASYFVIQYQGEPAVLAWFHEITDRVRSERLKNEFISTVNHELRTPLTAINGALGLISNGVFGQLNEAIAPMIVLAEKNTRRLMGLVNDLLDMEKMTAGKMMFDMQRQSIYPLLQQTVEINQHYQHDRCVRLVLHPVAQEFFLDIDSQRMMQIMANLLSNAIKYSPDEADVDIFVEAIAPDRLRISVCDQGTGIPEDFQQKIFEKFTQADSTDSRKKGGTGLGLAITRELVLGMGGTISFVSLPDRGTSFQIEFPLIAIKDFE